MIGWDLLALGLPAAGAALRRAARFRQHLELPGVWLERGRIAADDLTLLDSPLGWAGQRVLATLWFAAGQRAGAGAARRAAGRGPRARRRATRWPPAPGPRRRSPRCWCCACWRRRVEPAMDLLVAVRAAWRAPGLGPGGRAAAHLAHLSAPAGHPAQAPPRGSRSVRLCSPPMYAPFFGLSKEPFSIAPDPRFLYMSEQHREALAHLLYGLGGGGGFVLLTGEIGAGKTTVFRCFLEQVPPHCTVAYVFNPKLSAAELLHTVCVEFGLAAPDERLPGAGTGSAGLRVADSMKAHVDALNAFLLDGHARGRQAVLDDRRGPEPGCRGAGAIAPADQSGDRQNASCCRSC